jgi:single-strand DNA-binding protein
MASFNKVILMGNLTRDPELTYTAGNMAICKVGVAVNRRYQNSQTQEWVEKATFVDITIWGKRGEAFHKFHKRGAQALFEGRLELDTWDDKSTGQKRSKLYVVADNWEFVGGKGAGAGGGQGQGGGYDSAPSGGGAPGGYGSYGGGGDGGDGGGAQASSSAPQGGDAGDFLGVDDTPF